MNWSKSGFKDLESAYRRFSADGEKEAADDVEKLYRKISGGCTPLNHHWPVSGRWCYCGHWPWKNGV
jgi:hypothetical protein